jgi:uncharacterized membrane protein
MDFLTALGLAIPAGLNASVPLLVVAVAQRAGWMHLRAPFDLMGEWWAIGLIAVLLLVEFVADKVPAVDHVNDLVQTIVRPTAGAVLMFAASGRAGEVAPVLMIVAGILAAGAVHAVKATARPAVNVTTAGVGTPVVSFLEDFVAFVTSVLALLAPVLALSVFALGFWLVWRAIAKRRRPAYQR